MTNYRIYYNFQIRDKKSGELVYTKKDTFDIESKDIDKKQRLQIQEKIREEAKEHCIKKDHEVLQANDYKIDEL